MNENAIRLGALFQDAFAYAADAHANQRRKASGTPYISHPMQVAGLALEHGADEELAAAALLHDVIEDTPTTHAELAERFTRRIADIVRACSDTEDHEEKSAWRPRKEAYLAHLRTESVDAALVSCADKVHNARSILSDLRTQGPSSFDRFTGKRDGTLWYYRALVDTFQTLDVPTALLCELEIAVEGMEALA